MSTLLGGSLLIKPATKLSQLSIDTEKAWPVITSTSHAPAWYNPSYANRKAINIAGASGAAVIPYSVTGKISASARDSSRTDPGGAFSNSLAYGMMGKSGTDGSAIPAGWIFDGINIPAGATIVSAYVSFVAHDTKADLPTLTIKGEKAASPADYGAVEDFTTRAYTTASVAWNPPSWTVEQVYNSADITSVINELVTAYGPYSNGKIAICVFGFSGAVSWVVKKAYSYDGDPKKAPILVINYTLAGGVQNNVVMPVTVNAGSGTDTGFNVNLNSNVRSDFADIRFTQSDGVTLLKHYIFPVTSGTTAIALVQLDQLLSTGKTIYMYYNNPAAADASDSTIFMIFESMLTAPNGVILGTAAYDGVNHWTRLTAAVNTTQGALRYLLGDPVNYGFVWKQRIGGGTGANSIFAFGESTDTFALNADNETTGFDFISDEFNSLVKVYVANTQRASVGKAGLSDNAFHTCLATVNQNAALGTSRDWFFSYDGSTISTGTSVTAPGRNPEFGWNARTGGSNNNHDLGMAAIFYYGTMSVSSYGGEEQYTVTTTYGVTTLKQLAASMNKGDLLTFDGTALIKIASDSVGKNLIAQDPGNLPTWGYPP